MQVSQVNATKCNPSHVDDDDDDGDDDYDDDDDSHLSGCATFGESDGCVSQCSDFGETSGTHIMTSCTGMYIHVHAHIFKCEEQNLIALL